MLNEIIFSTQYNRTLNISEKVQKNAIFDCKLNRLMKDTLRQFVSQFGSLSEKEIEEIVDTIELGQFKKGSILLMEGDISSKCYFVLKGCVRQYKIVDGEEKTTAFYTEGQSIVSFSEYTTQAKSKHILICVEDCLLIIGDLSTEKGMYEKFPKLEAITRMMMEQDFGKTQAALELFITSSPEERYLNLLETNPNLLQRVPQHQLASYLGVTAESLSRIKKRIIQKKY